MALGVLCAMILVGIGLIGVGTDVSEGLVDVPGTEVVQLEQGDHGGWLHYDLSGGTGNIAIFDPSGEEVVLEPWDSDVSYTVEWFGDSYELYFTFEAATDGPYTVIAECDIAQKDGLLVGPDETMVRDTFIIVAVGLLVGGLIAAVGLVIVVVTAVRSTRAGVAAPKPVPSQQQRP